jgi:lysosomal alpha-glucosidase
VTTVWWAKQLKDFHKEVQFDGVWIDMNEPSNVYDGQQGGCPASPLESPPYTPGIVNPIQRRTICMTAKHYAGPHYNIHNMYAIYEAKATQEALLALRPQSRPFIISRASSTGMGRYGSHWTGDVYSSWDNLKASIPTTLNFNMFGVPLVGADICGFTGDTTEELCARWHELGAFYGFTRNHNTIGAKDQDPVSLGPVVTAAAKNSLLIRYAMLPYLYTLFYRASAFGETVMRPLFFDFPLDKNVYPLEEQFMWGPSVLISPVLAQGKLDVTPYFPAGNWYDFETKQLIINSTGETKTLDMPLEKISVALRGGSVIPTQNPKVTTTEQHSEPFNLIVVLDADGKASGELYWDDGDNIYSTLLMNFSWLKFDVQNNKLTSTPLVNNYSEDFTANTVTILGLPSAVTKATANGKDAQVTYTANVAIISFNETLVNPLEVTWT